MKNLMQFGKMNNNVMFIFYHLISSIISCIFRLAILGELLNCIDSDVGLINLGNIQEVLTTITDLLNNITQSNELKNIRRSMQIILKQRSNFLMQKSILDNFGGQECRKLVQYLLSDTNTDFLIIVEKQILLQLLISNKLLSIDECTKLLNLFMSNTIYKRTETINTVKCILENADNLGFQKTSEVMVSCFQWLYSESNRNQGQNIVLNLKPIEADLIAETSALAMINILSEAGLPKYVGCTTGVATDRHYQLFLYKFTRKFICLESKNSPSRRSTQDVPKESKQELQTETTKTKTCLFQSNYECVMRLLDLKISQDISSDALLKNLESLIKISALMKYLLQYEIFTEDTYIQCPLIKRIGLFLNHIKVIGWHGINNLFANVIISIFKQLSLKSNMVENMNRTTTIEILKLLKKLLIYFTNNSIMLLYLESQPIQEIIDFLCTTITYTGISG